MSGKTPDIRVKRVHDEVDGTDGYRILVDRLWPRGLSKDRAAVDTWVKNTAPSADLRRWFGHDPDKWQEFQSRYYRELDANPDAVAQLIAAMPEGRVTFLYGTKEREFNNAVALRQYILRVIAA